MPAETENRNLKSSIKDGVSASLMTGFTADYLTPFILFLGGTTRHVAVLSALPSLLASMIQIKSPDIVERLGSRKKVITLFAFLQGVMLVPMTASYFLGKTGPAVFIAMTTLFTSFAAIIAPAWGSLMADIVKEKRGEYFGWRSRLLGITTILATLTAGFILHQSEKISLLAGFGAIFSLALVFRLVSWHYLKKMDEPPLEKREEDYFSLKDFLSRARESNFARFVFYIAITKFCVHVASPFFAVFMLRDLKFDYLTYTLITVAASLATILTIKSWGVHADKVGNLSVIKLTSRLVAFIPLLWLLNQNPLFLFFVQVFSGFAWAGFNLSATNFIYDAVSQGKRARCIAYFNLFGGLSLSLGAIVGGLLARYLDGPVFESSLMNLILISALLRFAAAFFMPFRLKEVREVEKVKDYELFLSILRLRPVAVRETDGRR